MISFENALSEIVCSDSKLVEIQRKQIQFSEMVMFQILNVVIISWYVSLLSMLILKKNQILMRWKTIPKLWFIQLLG